MRCLTLLLLLFSCARLHADGVAKLTREASVYYEAGEWDEAISRYRKAAREGGLSAEQRATARYNLAAALLASGDLSSALEQLNPAALGSDPSPLLEERWQKARALACWRLAAKLEERAIDSGVATLCDEGISRCREGWEALQGVGECDALRDGLKESMGRLRALRAQLELASLSMEQLIVLLSQETSGSVSLLEQFSEKEERAQRLSQIALCGRRLLPAWRELQKRGEALVADAMERAELDRGESYESEEELRAEPQVQLAAECERATEGSAELFEMSLGSLGEGHLWEGRALQAQAKIVLRLLLAMERGEDPLHPLLQQRIALLEREGSVELLDALDQERSQLCTVAQGVAHQMAGGIEDPVVSLLLSSLADRLHEEGLDPARYDLVLYEQLSQPEEETLLQLYRAGGSSEQLRAIEERFVARAEVEPSSDLEGVLSHLKSARQGSEMRPHLDAALRLFSPPCWLRLKIGEARSRAQGGATAQLLKELASLVEVAREHCSAEVAAPLHRSMESVEQGLVQLSQDHPLCSGVCMMDVRHRLERVETLLEGEEEEENPQLTLQKAIAEQKHALALVQSTEGAAQSESIFEPIIALDELAEQEVLDIAYTIHPDLFDEELRPLFLQGAVEAEAARRALSMRRPDWSKAMGHQRKAIELWEQLLHRDQEREDEGEGGGEESDDSSPSPSDSQEEEEEISQAETSPQQIYEWLEQMEREDKQSQPARVKVKQGARPW